MLKELADNGLDAGAMVKVGELRKKAPSSSRTTAPASTERRRILPGCSASLARWFPASYLRLPQRGALGNGLRVVASAVLVSGGTLAVITHNKRIEMQPERDGTTTVIKVTPVKQPVGTRIEIVFGPALPCNHDTLLWAHQAIAFARGKAYDGLSSPFWYDLPNFYELLSASGDIPVQALIKQLDGGTAADAIVIAAGLQRTRCNDVTQKQAAILLDKARAHVARVLSKQLGEVGAALSRQHAYAQNSGPRGLDRTSLKP